MLELKNSKWIDLIKTYKELTLLWDPKHKHYSNSVMRQKAYEQVFEKYKIIDGKASLLHFLLHFKKKFDNMRATYHRERKKVELSKKIGTNYKPTLWYFKHLRFLDATLDTTQRTDTHTYFNRYNNMLYLESSPARSLIRRKKSLNSPRTSKSQVEVKVKSGFIHIEPLQSSEEEDDAENIQPSPQPQNRLVDLLQKQENFITTVSKLLSTKDKDWQVIGKAIGSQLYRLGPTQRVIAQKLINDIIYFGTSEKLTVESFVHASERKSPVNIKKECIYYLDSDCDVND